MLAVLYQHPCQNVVHIFFQGVRSQTRSQVCFGGNSQEVHQVTTYCGGEYWSVFGTTQIAHKTVFYVLCLLFLMKGICGKTTRLREKNAMRPYFQVVVGGESLHLKRDFWYQAPVAGGWVFVLTRGARMIDHFYMAKLVGLRLCRTVGIS